ncbi:uncharacterized protein LOC108089806 [Drosophila ficusphila]|uniref:uncharacterized protein LOC108089806 n=1 Tax=Drosophila ficusphila TaxID=30025 RepID=UPI0007E8AAC4|nr:uncharacterized protein LOC108089806 [Drosophila ficusphila]
MFRALLILVVGVTTIWAINYDVLIEDPDIYLPCTESPPGSISIHDLFDLRNLTLELEEDGIHVSGSATVKWDLPATDRISASFSVMQYNRGTWEPTVFNVNSPDFCKAIFEKDEYWYKYWFKNLRNTEEIREKCIKKKGTLLLFDPFVMELQLNQVTGPNLRGRYKAVITFDAFDEYNVRRNTSVCFEIRGDLQKTS